MKDELKGFMSFKEFSDWAFKTGQLPYNQNDFIYEYDCELIEKILMPKLTEKQNRIIITSTPKQNNSYFSRLSKE